jgi:hypothetical protein
MDSTGMAAYAVTHKSGKYWIEETVAGNAPRLIESFRLKADAVWRAIELRHLSASTNSIELSRPTVD